MEHKNKDTRKYWFPAKKYGWGWGLPSAWQGWLVFAIYICSIFLNILFLLNSNNKILFYLGIGFLTIILLLVCWIKGEPPKWRWGK